jgi:hypothetical protein
MDLYARWYPCRERVPTIRLLGLPFQRQDSKAPFFTFFSGLIVTRLSPFCRLKVLGFCILLQCREGQKL